MKALLLKEYKKFEINELAEPALGPDDILVRVKASGLCGRDGQVWFDRLYRREPNLMKVVLQPQVNGAEAGTA